MIILPIDEKGFLKVQNDKRFYTKKEMPRIFDLRKTIFRYIFIGFAHVVLFYFL